MSFKLVNIIKFYHSFIGKMTNQPSETRKPSTQYMNGMVANRNRKEGRDGMKKRREIRLSERGRQKLKKKNIKKNIQKRR